MLVGKNSIQETYYDVLSVREDATFEEIRTSYRSAVLNYHPDKLRKVPETSDLDHESGDRFLKVQKAWEILNNSRSRAIYDNELQASRRDTIAAEDVSLEDMMVEDTGEALELVYQCRCGDYFSVDSLELGGMGYTLLRDESEISLQAPDALPTSVILPCGSCSLKVRLMINADIKPKREMGSGEGSSRWTVFDGVKIIPSTPETLMAEIDTAIANLEHARATAFLDSPTSSPLKNKSSDARTTPQYDARMADEAYKAGCAALAAGKLDEALHSLNISLSKCPPDKTSAVAKLQSLISLTSQQLQKSPS